jgi:hypothetical protein
MISCKNDKKELQMISSYMELHIVANWIVTYYKISSNVVIDNILPKTTCFVHYKFYRLLVTCQHVYQIIIKLFVRFCNRLGFSTN